MHKSAAQLLHAKRGKPPKGMKWRDRNVYMPSGPEKNVAGTKVKNFLIAENININHNAWFNKKFGGEHVNS